MSSKLPIAVISPHEGFAIPEEVKPGLALSEAAIFNESDAGVEHLFGRAERVLFWESFSYARAIIDVNRMIDGANRPGDGAIKEQTSYGYPVYRRGKKPSGEICRHLIDRYWHPWHQRLAEIAADDQVKLVIDAHTMAAKGPTTYDDPNAWRPKFMVGNLGDEYGNRREGNVDSSASAELAQGLADLLALAGAELPALTPVCGACRINFPFRGGADLRLHGGKQQPWLMVEVNRSLFIGEQNSETPISPPNKAALERVQKSLWEALERFVAEFIR